MNKQIEELCKTLSRYCGDFEPEYVTSITKTEIKQAAAALRLIGPLVAEHREEGRTRSDPNEEWYEAERALDEYRRNKQ